MNEFIVSDIKDEINIKMILLVVTNKWRYSTDSIKIESRIIGRMNTIKFNKKRNIVSEYILE